MDRRTFLRRVGGVGALAGGAGLAGCLDGGSKSRGSPTDGDTRTFVTASPTPTPEIASGGFSYTTPEPGLFVVTLTVVNRGDASRDVSATVELTIGGETKTNTKDVTVAADSSKDVEFEFDVPEGESFSDLQFDIEPQNDG